VLLQLHGLIARSLVLYFALVGLWGVYLAIRKADLPPAYRGALFIAVVVGLIQAGVGLTLLLTVGHPPSDLHYLYGASVILTLPLVASYIADKKFSRVLAFGLANLFMAGLAIRAITTGS
jgi:hypothetical protein